MRNNFMNIISQITHIKRGFVKNVGKRTDQ